MLWRRTWEEAVTHFINNICEVPDCKYLEVGVFQGAMFASALQGNNIVANAVDNWSDTHNVPMRDIDIKAEKEDTKQVFLKNIRPYTGGKSVTVTDSDSAESLSKIPVKSNVVLYDGEHTEEAHFNFLTKYNSKIDNTFCLIIDDWNWLQVRTGTGRLSSSNPNFQNLPRGGTATVRKAVVSRFPGGKILEADFGQLEFRIAVWMSNDATGRKEIDEGFDVHAYTSKVLTEAGQKTSRQDAKARTFRPLYGGVKGSAAEMEYNKSFMKKYSGIATWHTALQEEVMLHKKITTVTGRQFAFPEVKRLRNGVTEATKIKNYPVQSGATADLVPLSCVLYNNITKSMKLKSKFINTVHDSIVLDIHPDELDIVPKLIYQAMMGVAPAMDKMFDINLDVPMEVELKIGNDWFDMTEIDVDKFTNLDITDNNIDRRIA